MHQAPETTSSRILGRQQTRARPNWTSSESKSRVDTWISSKHLPSWRNFESRPTERQKRWQPSKRVVLRMVTRKDLRSLASSHQALGRTDSRQSTQSRPSSLSCESLGCIHTSSQARMPIRRSCKRRDQPTIAHLIGSRSRSSRWLKVQALRW